MIQPLPVREGRWKRQRQNNRGGEEEEAAAPWEEELSLDEFYQGDQPMEDIEGMEEVFATLSAMKTEVELMRRPLGTFESPARTCKELMMVQTNNKDG